MVDALVKYIQWIFFSIKGVRAVWIDSFSHLYDADWRSESWTDEDAVVFGERHLILRQNDGNDACRVTSLRHVLVLLYVQRQRQTCNTHLQNNIVPSTGTGKQWEIL